MLFATLVLLLHAGPPVWAELVLSSDELRFHVAGEPDALAICMGAGVELLGPERATSAEVRDAFAEFLGKSVLIEVAGRSSELVLQEVHLPTGDEEWPVARAVFVVELDAVPRRVSVAWHAWQGTQWEGEALVPLTVVRGGRLEELAQLDPDEPGFTWHAPTGERQPRAIAAVSRETEYSEVSRIPLLSIGVVVLAIGVFAVATRRGASPPVRAASLFGGLLGAALLSDVGVLVATLPSERVAMPGRGQAVAIFETLHRNVYAAFEAETEGEIYDLLAVSVDPELLDELYGEVLGSLVMREEGGAISSIEEVEVLARDVVPIEEDEAGEPAFRADWSWRVHGLVSHWGHVHRRVNEYAARYTVRHDRGTWKIFEVEVLEHRRLDADDEASRDDSAGSGGTPGD